MDVVGLLESAFGPVLAPLAGPTLIVAAAVAFARGLAPRVFVSGVHAKTASTYLALATGLLLGAAGMAPDIVHSGLTGKLGGGLVAAALATFGYQMFRRTVRSAKAASGRLPAGE